MGFLARHAVVLGLMLAIIATHMPAAATTSSSSESINPISISPDSNWDGIDGRWSTFTLQVGSSLQIVRTVVSFSSYQTWVVLSQGCEAAEDYSACAFSRGGIFYPNDSTTFESVGTFELPVGSVLGLNSNANYGYDLVALGVLGDGAPPVSNAVVGGMALETFYLGVFGLNPRSTNFTSTDNPSQKSFIAKLKDQGSIPSISAGYTAGAPYRSAGVLASLTLGGYDRARLVENNFEFPFWIDGKRDLVVALQQITTPSRVPSSPVATLLLPNPIYAYIDTTFVEFWLPLEACLAFEVEFGLVYDDTTELYLVNDTLHSDLLNRKANVTFTLGQTLEGGDAVRITLPYDAFDLNATNPYQGLSNSSNYFPLRRAANDTQYILGRTFFQEAYLSVNWELGRFNVSQVNWSQMAKDIVTMAPGPTSGHTPKLSAGAIAGIVIGVVVSLLISGCLAFFCLRKRRTLKLSEKNRDEESERDRSAQQGYVKAELEGSRPQEDSDPFSSARSSTREASDSEPTTFTGSVENSSSVPTFTDGTDSTRSSNERNSGALSPLSEADGKERVIYEMAGDVPVVNEKDSKALTEKEAHAHRERVYNGVESPPLFTYASSTPPLRRVSLDPSHVALVRRRNERNSTVRTSATGSSGSTVLVSPDGSGDGTVSTYGIEPTLIRSPKTLRRAFSFEIPTSPFDD